MKTIQIPKPEGVNLVSLNQALSAILNDDLVGATWDSGKRVLYLVVTDTAPYQDAVTLVEEHDPSVLSPDQMTNADRKQALELLNQQAQSALDTISEQLQEITAEITAVSNSSLPASQIALLNSMLARQQWYSTVFARLIKTVLFLAKESV